jgi:hypothetical protein
MPPKSNQRQLTLTGMFAAATQRQPNDLLSATQGAQLGTSGVSLSPPDRSSAAAAASIPRGDPTLLARIYAAEETDRMAQQGLPNQASYLQYIEPNDTMRLPLSQDAQYELDQQRLLDAQLEQQRQQQRQQDALLVQQTLDAKQSRANARNAQRQANNPGVLTQFDAPPSPGGGAGMRGRINKTNFFTFKGRRKSKKSKRKSKKNKMQKKKNRRSRGLVK